MTDLSKTITPKSDQLNSDDLISGPMTIKITTVRGDEGNKDQPIVVSFEGDGGKGWRPCKSMRRVLVSVWGKDGAAYAGRSLTLYRDPTVTWGGLAVGGIRISHMSGMDTDMTMALTATKQSRKPYTVKRLKDAPKPVDAPAPSPEFDPMPDARDAASKGKASFTAWWNGDGKQYREQVKPNMAELTALAAKADAPPPDDDDLDMPM